jgi:carbonic anhydrase
MRIKKVIWLSFILLMVVISSVQAIPYFSTIGAIDLLGTNSTNPLPEREANIIPTSTFGHGLIIPFSPVPDVLQDHGGNNITGQVQNDDLVEQLLQGNLKFRDDVYNASIERNQELVAGQNPGVLWIGCSDSRSDPERITSAEPGELFITRNVGNIVSNHDWSMAAVLEYSINYLNVQEIIICGHSDCGAIKALDKNLNDPYISLWLNDAREAKTRVDSRIPVPKTPEEMKERYHQMELENVRLQVEHLMTYPSVKKAVNEGRVNITGLYYDLATGTLSVVT